MTVLDRCRGSLLGLACGDALGTTVEFRAPGTFAPIEDMVGGGTFRLVPGQWTDDTSMALCLAESLVERGGFDPADQMQRYLRWWREGYLSSTGSCFDIGGTTSSALEQYQRTGDPFSGPAYETSAGNGSLMRLAPVPLYFHADPRQAIHLAGQSSRTTHAHPAAVDACRFFAGLILGALTGVGKEELLSPGCSPVPGLWEEQPLSPRIAAVAGGSFADREPPAIRGSGYVVECLEAALWAFHRSASFREGALLAANLGDDADTTAAVYGQLAGAHYGVQGIPSEWLERLAMREYIEELAEGLAGGPDAAPSAASASHEGRDSRRPPAARTARRPGLLPFARSYWVVEGKLLAGFYPGDIDRREAETRLEGLLDAGIRCVVNLVAEEEIGAGGQPLRPYQQLLSPLARQRGLEVTYLRVPIPDQSVPTAATMTLILDAIDSAIGRGQPTYVHCWGGRGRTGTVIGCYLARHGIAQGDAALRRITHLRRKDPTADHPSPENAEQEEMVRGWGEGE